MNKYWEILILWKCKCCCYYCLWREMAKANMEDQLSTDFHTRENFNNFLNQCKKEWMNIIYLSSVNTDPALYMYLPELIQYLQERDFNVWIRANAANITVNNINTLLSCNSEISISLNAYSPETSIKIAWIQAKNEMKILQNFLNKVTNQTVRVSIVINKYNKDEIFDIINQLNDKYYNKISYIQLRQVYKYKDKKSFEQDREAFKSISEYFNKNIKLFDNFFESKIYKIWNIKISLWETVFKKESIKSLNYFTNWAIVTNNFLVPWFENNENY